MSPALRRWDPPGGAAAEVLWLHGLQSDQGGEKAAIVRERMLAAGRAFSSVDFRGHGETGGELRDLTCTGLLEDCTAAVAAVPEGRRLVLVGSSMGAWTAARWSLLHPDRVAALVLVAPSYRFPEVLVEHVGPAAAERWEREGAIRIEGGPGPAEFGWGLIEDGRRYRPADLPAGLAAPTLVVHGMKDESCDWRESVAFAEGAERTVVDLLLLKDADHRLSGHRRRLAGAVDAFLESLGL